MSGLPSCMMRRSKMKAQHQQQRWCTFHVPVRVHASMGGEEYSMACACVFFSIQPPAWPAHRFQRIDCFILPVTQIFFRFVLVTFLFVAWESIDRSILRKLNGYSTNKQASKQLTTKSRKRRLRTVNDEDERYSSRNNGPQHYPPSNNEEHFI